MIPREKLIKALRSKHFSFKRRTDRIELYKQRGSTKRIELRNHAQHDPKYAEVILRQAGFTPEEIDSFIRECDKSKHH